MSRLRALFHFGRAGEPAGLSQEEQSRDHNLKRLQDWLPETVRKLASKLEGAPLRESGPYSIWSHETNVDTSNLTASDLQTLAPYFEELHELCMKHDVHLEIAGFDRLPKDGISTANSWSKGPAVLIEIDSGRTYNRYSHPKFSTLDKRNIEPQSSAERPRTCQIKPGL